MRDIASKWSGLNLQGIGLLQDILYWEGPCVLGVFRVYTSSHSTYTLPVQYNINFAKCAQWCTWCSQYHMCTVVHLSGYSQKRPPCLIGPNWPCCYYLMNIILAFFKGHLFNVATVTWQIGWPC